MGEGLYESENRLAENKKILKYSGWGMKKVSFFVKIWEMRLP
jgi:hypothetical protein